MSLDHEPDVRRVAVINIHGVSDQQPRQTARQIVDVLSRSADADYGGFKESTLRLPVEAKIVDDTVTSAGDFGSDLYVSQVKDFQPLPPDHVYETVCVRGKRRGDRPVDVDTYEMFYADISRAKSGVINIFFGFYEILFRLCQLGVQTLSYASREADEKARPWWHRARSMHRFVDTALTIVVPWFNIFIVAVIVSAFPNRVPVEYQPHVASAMLVLISVVICRQFFWGYTSDSDALLPIWAFTPLLIGAVVWVLAFLLSSMVHSFARSVLSIETMIVCWFVIAKIAGVYERRRPGAVFWMRVVAVITVTIWGYWMYQIAPQKQSDFAVVTLRSVNILVTIVASVWALIQLGIIGSTICSTVAARLTGGDQERAWRASFTSVIALTVPASIFLLVTLSLFAGLYEAVADTMLTFKENPLIGGITLKEYAFDLVSHGSANPGIPFALVLWAMAIFLGLWGFIPVVIAGARPTRAINTSKDMGTWLDYGYRGAVVAVWCSFLALPVCVVLGGLVEAYFAPWHISQLHDYPLLMSLVRLNEQFLSVMGYLIAGTTVGLFAFRSQLRKLIDPLWPIVDIVMDVDNLLKTRPQEYTPRARITARYLALLNHIARQRDRRGRQYDEVIIVAHSLGTVVTADLLRFIRRHPGNHLFAREFGNGENQRPVHFVTLGSPLRQLVSWRFPYLYGWVRDAPATTIDDMQLASWTNLYRSGDYVGRFIFRSDEDPDRYDPSKEKVDGRATDACLGAGEHTRYYSHKVAELARRCDALIVGS